MILSAAMVYVFLLSACVYPFRCHAGIPEVTIAPGVSMPMLAFGTSPITYKGCSVKAAVSMYLKLGVRHLDLGLYYGTEKEVGEAVKESGIPRSELFLAGKVEGPVGYENALAQIIDLDLPNTGLNYFDLLLMHYPCSTYGERCGTNQFEKRLSTWQALEHLKAIGKARAIGVSNFDWEQLNQLRQAGFQPAVNQVQWHLGYHDDALLGEAVAGGTLIEAWASLGSPVVGGYGMVKPGISLEDPRLDTIARRYNASAAQIALQWMIQMGVTPVTGTCSETHVRADLKSFDIHLSSYDVAYLNNLSINEAQYMDSSALGIQPSCMYVLVLTTTISIAIAFLVFLATRRLKLQSAMPDELTEGIYISL